MVPHTQNSFSLHYFSKYGTFTDEKQFQIRKMVLYYTIRFSSRTMINRKQFNKFKKVLSDTLDFKNDRWSIWKGSIDYKRVLYRTLTHRKWFNKFQMVLSDTFDFHNDRSSIWKSSIDWKGVLYRTIFTSRILPLDSDSSRHVKKPFTSHHLLFRHLSVVWNGSSLNPHTHCPLELYSFLKSFNLNKSHRTWHNLNNFITSSLEVIIQVTSYL